MANRISAEEARWRAESDARTLASANEIMSDKSRFKNAQDAAKKAYESTMKSAGAMKTVFSCGGKATTGKKKK